MLGNEEDFTACLGLEVEGADENLTELDSAAFRAMIERASAEFPNFAVVATTLRAVHSATVNDWSAIAWSRRPGFVEATPRPDLEILDRVGGGDSFASGLVYGLLEHGDLQTGGRVRRRARRARDDDARRHLDGNARRGRGARPRRRRPRRDALAVDREARVRVEEVERPRVDRDFDRVAFADARVRAETSDERRLRRAGALGEWSRVRSSPTSSANSRTSSVTAGRASTEK